MYLTSCLFPISIFFSHVSANVEKTIFLGPPAITIPTQHPNLDDLLLIPLSPVHSTARFLLNATFPTQDATKGTETWMLLDGLTPGARYEIRICWLATAPTSFWIYTHTLPETFDRPDLITSLTSYAYARQAELNDFDVQQLLSRRKDTQALRKGPGSSLLFLQIFAAADYFSLNNTLMTEVPPVLVDVILDRYLLNIFPQSLVPTGVYIAILAIVGWFASQAIWRLLVQIADSGVAGSPQQPDNAEKKRT